MTKELVFQVGGMTCSGCESRIEKVLGRLDGVRSAAADHRSGEVRVLLDRGQTSAQAIATQSSTRANAITSDLEGSG